MNYGRKCRKQPLGTREHTAYMKKLMKSIACQVKLPHHMNCTILGVRKMQFAGGKNVGRTKQGGMSCMES